MKEKSATALMISSIWGFGSHGDDRDESRWSLVLCKVDYEIKL